MSNPISSSPDKYASVIANDISRFQLVELSKALTPCDRLRDKPAGANLPAQPTCGDLKLNPVWDALRRHPGFAGLMQKSAQPAAK
jgi:hypothetical protein